MPEGPSPAGAGQDGGVASGELRLTETQRQILAALCRPCAGGNRYATPATNQEIAAEVFLSVDAVKAHLRALYRKFGVEPLPHNQKRARLVELFLEGGYVAAPPDGEVEGGAAPPPPPPPRPEAAQRGPWRRPLLIGAALVAAAAVAVALVVILGGEESGEEAPQTTTKPEYVEAVNGFCALALGALGGEEQGSTAARAGRYLGVFDTMNGRLATLTPPPGLDRDLERFRAGLRSAADFTTVVAQGPPPAGSPERANVVAELTFAAGQVQAGALGYDLGPDCSAIGNLVARSARNAAAAP